MFEGFDHVAIVVKNTEEALRFYRDTLGLPLLFSEVMADQNVRLTHLDLGGGHLQLVEPLTADHPLSEHLRKHGEGLHHLSFDVPDVRRAIMAGIEHGVETVGEAPRKGAEGREIAFFHPLFTHGVLIEVAGPRNAKQPPAKPD